MLQWALHMQAFVLPVTEIGSNCLGVAESNIWPAVFKPQGMKEAGENQCYSQTLHLENVFIKYVESYHSSSFLSEAD